MLPRHVDQWTRRIFGIALLMWVWAVPLLAYSQQSSGLVKPQPEVFEVGMGQVERLAIVLENASDVYGIDIRAKFDPSMVEIADADPQKDGVQMIAGNFPKPDFLVRNQADNSAGSLMYVITQVNPSPPANGNGVVFYIEIRGKKMGETPFTIEFVDAADREGKTLKLDKQGGLIRVVKPKPPTPTFTPTQGITDTTVIATKAPKKHKATPTILISSTPEVQEQRTKLTTNQILIGVAGGSFIGAALLFGYVFFKQHKG